MTSWKETKRLAVEIGDIIALLPVFAVLYIGMRIIDLDNATGGRISRMVKHLSRESHWKEKHSTGDGKA